MIGIITNVVFSNIMESTASESTIQMIGQANANIESKIQNIETTMKLIERHPQVLEFFRMKDMGDSSGKTIIESTVRGYLAGFTENNLDIEGIALINQNDDFISNELYKIKEDPLTEEKWYKDCVRGNSAFNLIRSPEGRNIKEDTIVSADEIVTLTRTVRDPTNGEIAGVIFIDLNLRTLKDLLNNIKLGKIGFIYIVGADGEPVYAPINEIVPRVRDTWFKGTAGVITRTIKGEAFQFIYTISTYTNWKIVGVFSLNETLQEVSRIRLYTFAIAIMVTIIAALISILFSSSLSRPIRKLRSLMKKVESGDMDVEFDVKYEDEIGQLGKSFNKMVGEIRILIGTVYKEQQSKREAELMTLQSQIKPHFLYNTLGSIYWMAKESGATNVMQMTSALIDLFRIGLSKGKEVISLKEEIEHVRNYLIILKVRYAEILEYEISVRQELESVYVQKLILQPIVENAVYHGIKEKGSPGKVKIAVDTDGEVLVLTVSDDGVGMSEEKLLKLNEALSDNGRSAEGYGISNVNERIRLSYGKEYGVRIKSTLGAGTTVEIRHPIIRNL
ncbi:MAG: sensor histidine kinase [Saccharofermentanales bacterium]